MWASTERCSGLAKRKPIRSPSAQITAQPIGPTGVSEIITKSPGLNRPATLTQHPAILAFSSTAFRRRPTIEPLS